MEGENLLIPEILLKPSDDLLCVQEPNVGARTSKGAVSDKSLVKSVEPGENIQLLLGSLAKDD